MQKRKPALEAVLEAIPWGAENKVTSDQIARRSNVGGDWRSNWNTRRVIRGLRMIGHPICSNNRGYWRSSDIVELRKCQESMEARIRNTKETCEFLSDIIKNMLKSGGRYENS